MKRPRHWLAPLLVTAAALIHPPSAPGQVEAEVEIQDGQGGTLVRNSYRSEVAVGIAVWESDETGERVALTRKADVLLWPSEFRLLPGETQTVRFLLDDGIYPSGTMLRLETRFTPAQPVPVVGSAGAKAPEAVEARLTIVTRILSKVRIR
jgi:P pilus assembly chaperone PapD